MAATSDVRDDGRMFNQIRQLSCELGVLSRADGSARFKQGSTTVLCRIFGPTATTTRDELYDRCTVHVQLRKMGSKGVYMSPEELELADLVKSHVEAQVDLASFPRSKLTISIAVQYADGSIASAVLNSVTAALLHGGIPLSCFVSTIECSIDCSSRDNGARILLDPTAVEETREASTTMLYTFDSSKDGNLSHAISRTGLLGAVSNTDLVRKSARSAAKSIGNFIRLSLSKAL